MPLDLESLNLRLQALEDFRRKFNLVTSLLAVFGIGIAAFTGYVWNQVGRMDSDLVKTKGDFDAFKADWRNQILAARDSAIADVKVAAPPIAHHGRA